ncbi:MAG: universal stress protein [Deltaproteobacteria bacterium]|nr:universal stress protein [Deltaproteobacteria bacterium]
MRKQIRRILAATDFSEVSGNVVPLGVKIARELDATLYVCHVIDLPTISLYGETVFEPIMQQQRYIDFARREIETLMEKSGGEGIDWEPVISVGQPVDEITSVVAEKNIDLVITATHGRSGLRRLFLGSVTERLMRALACPLLLFKVDAPESSRHVIQRFPFRRILVGCDFSDDSNRAVEFGISMSQEFESELHLVHVVEPTAYNEYFRLPSGPEEPLQQDLYDSIREKLGTLIPGEALDWCTAKSTVLVGKPYAEIVRYAGINDIDLICLGVRGHGMVEEILIGSTTDRVVRRAPCPVLSMSPAVK